VERRVYIPSRRALYGSPQPVTAARFWRGSGTFSKSLDSRLKTAGMTLRRVARLSCFALTHQVTAVGETMCKLSKDKVHAMKKLLILAVSVLLIWGSEICSAADTGPRDPLAFSVRVQLDVSAQKDMERRVTDYLTRDLRSLGDVLLVETNPEWVLSIIAAELESQSGDKTGVVLSITLLAPFDDRFFKEYVIPDCAQKGPRVKHFIDLSLADLYQLRDHWVEVGPNLESVCSSLTANFNKRHLEEQRKIWQAVLKDLQKQK
jgi:hypothetical protein